MIERRTFMGSIAAIMGGLVLPKTPTLILPEPGWKRQSFRIGFGEARVQGYGTSGDIYPMLRTGLNQIPIDGLLRLLGTLKDPTSRVIYDGDVANKHGL